MNLLFFGGFGTDAGGWWIGPDGVIHRVPGWNPESVIELEHAVNILRQAAQLKEEGLGQRIIEAVMPFVQEQLSANFKEGSIAIGG